MDTRTIKTSNGGTVVMHGLPDQRLFEAAMKELYLKVKSRKEKAA